MKSKKKLYIILGIVLVLLVALILYFVVFNKKTNQIECDNITGGSYNLVFKSDNETLNTMNVCIACPPNTYSELLSPTKEGYQFLGWFHDEKLEKNVTMTSSMDIEPVAKKDKNGCTLGYEDITLYAKWLKDENKSITISFDSNGGTTVNNIILECNDDTATITKLPTPTRDSYNFIAWKDNNEMPILEGSKLTCNGNLTLKASWDKQNNPVSSEPEKNILINVKKDGH